MKNIIYIIPFVVFFSCLSNRHSITIYRENFKEEDGGGYRQLVLYDDGKYTYKTCWGMTFAESKGYYTEKSRGRYVLNSYIQVDSVTVLKYDRSINDSAKITLSDFNNRPIANCILITDDDRRYLIPYEGIELSLKQSDFFMILSDNFYTGKIDTIVIKNDNAAKYHVKKVNTFLNSNRIFFENVVFETKGNKIKSKNKQITKSKILLKLRKDSV